MPPSAKRARPVSYTHLDVYKRQLLRPEVLSRYAAAVVRKVRKHPQELGCIREDELLAGNLDYQDFQRLPPEDEAVVLRTLLETFVSRAWCLRQPGEGSSMLTFPSYFRRERKEQPSHPSVLDVYKRQPLNRERRFIPLRLDDSPIRSSLAQFLYIDWRPRNRGEEYSKLVEACRPEVIQPAPEQPVAGEGLLERIFSLGHTNSVQSVAWSPDGPRALSGSCLLYTSEACPT